MDQEPYTQNCYQAFQTAGAEGAGQALHVQIATLFCVK